MEIRIDEPVLDHLLAEAASAHPRECCGVLLGQRANTHIVAIKPAQNVHRKPESNFEIDPQALIDAHRVARSEGPQVVGYYHSHPNGIAEPSVTDRERSLRDGSIWVIVARGQVTFWRDGDGGFVPLPYRIAGR